MSGETNRADDFDDFILDDEPAVLGLGGMFAQQPGSNAFPVQESGENALLFESAVSTPAESEFGDLREFSEDALGTWEGHTLQPQEIGIPVDSDGLDPLTAPVEDLIQDSGDLQLVDEECQLAAINPEDELFAEPADQDPVAGETHASQPASTVLVDGHFPGAVQQGDGWESIELGGSRDEQQESPAWVGEEQHEAEADDTVHEVRAAQEPQPGDSEDASGQAWDAAALASESEVEEPVEEAMEPGFAGAGSSSSADDPAATAPVLPMQRRWGAALAAAAALLLFGTGTAVAVDPKLFGMESLVGPGLFAPASDDSVAMAPVRPAAKPVVRPVAAPSPVVQPAPEAAPAPVDPVAVVPVQPAAEPAVAEPAPRQAEPVAVAPSVNPPPQPSVPVEPVSVAVVETAPAPEPAVPVEPVQPAAQPVAAAAVPEATQANFDEVVQRTIKVGDSLRVGGFVQQDAGTAVDVAGLTPGMSALAHLHNGNYFIGTVKAVDASMVTIKLDKGEVTIASAEIRKVSKLGSAEFLELQRSVSGFVRLSNNNRLVGSILSSVADDNIVLEMKSDRIILPKSAIDEIVRQPEQGEVRFDLGESEEKWLQDLAERQLRAIEKERSDRANEAKTPKSQQTRD